MIFQLMLLLELVMMQIWDFSSYLNSLAELEGGGNEGNSSVTNHSPLMKFSGHKDEGYAIDWSPVTTGRLVTGILI